MPERLECVHDRSPLIADYRTSLRSIPTAVRYSAIQPMFWSLVRPDKILLPITRSAAVTTSLEADESSVGMITCEMFKEQESWEFPA